ncbi:acVLRF1 family peptidyl-tRNA hydrolase [Catenuloplanes sp. NPDC051500]|uniref:acVLRF1 family peptidyl-tRNA hydrolase n=1 Tax=Catenuloplanes sp. NPDC051500 TaxID=3363959 RepID=UPI00379C40A8
MRARPVAGGGRQVEVVPGRLARWLDNFTARHGQPLTSMRGYAVRLEAPDGAVAELHAPPGAPEAADPEAFLAAAVAPRPLGLLLARKSAVAVGYAVGDELRESKVDTSYVQSRTAAGGWSQQRFARRRDNQAKAAAGDAVDIVLRLLVPRAAELSALVTGGDRKTIETILSDRRLEPLLALRAERFLDVPEPRHAVLVAALPEARAVTILLTD